MKAHDCYKCKFRGTLSTTHHSKCGVITYEISPEAKHLAETLEMSIAAGAHAIVDKTTGEPLVRLNPHGVENGWAIWPLNFDPIWVDFCPFYSPKGEINSNS
jgi:hypothetical protein